MFKKGPILLQKNFKIEKELNSLRKIVNTLRLQC